MLCYILAVRCMKHLKRKQAQGGDEGGREGGSCWREMGVGNVSQLELQERATAMAAEETEFTGYISTHGCK